MIDFRYHLVSIVSVFLALAVGIVLGAGPLKGEVGDTLTSEVQQLRDDRTDLRSQLDEANTRAEASENYIQQSASTVLAGRLPGRSIALVVAPGADSDVVAGVTTAIQQAGAMITSSTTIEDTWFDATRDDAKNRTASELAPGVGIESGSTPDGELIDNVLAQALVGLSGAVNPGSRATLEGLDDADLISLRSPDIAPATAAVIVTGPLTGGDTEERARRAELLAGLGGVFDATSAGAVVVGSEVADAGPDTGAATTAIRGDSDLARAVSTVDDADLQMGQVSVALALAEQVAGGVGQYGLSSGATAVFPPITDEN